MPCVAAFLTDGEDFTVHYHLDLDDVFKENDGTIDFTVIGNHLDSLLTTALPGEAPVESANTVGGGVDGTPAPSWQSRIVTGPSSPSTQSGPIASAAPASRQPG